MKATNNYMDQQIFFKKRIDIYVKLTRNRLLYLQ